MLLRGLWLQENERGRWWSFRCDGCGSERAMRAEDAGSGARGLGLKTVAVGDGGKLEHYCPACQRKGA